MQKLVGQVNWRQSFNKSRLFIRAIWSEFSLGAFWIAKDAKFLRADNEGSIWAARMRRLIWVFVERTSEGTFSHVAVHMVEIIYNLPL